MLEVKDENGEIHTCPSEVLKAQYQYYSKVYTSNSRTKFSLKNDGRNRISIIDWDRLEEQMTKEELYFVVKHFKSRKTPGVDGLVAEFYQKYWNGIVDTFYDTVCVAFDNNELHISACS